MKQWRDSGLTQQAFCEFHGIGLHRLSYQIRKEKNTEPDGLGFRKIEKNMEGSSDRLCVVYPNGVKIECAVEFSVLRKLIHLY